jgi:hypothetical protein
MPRRPVYANFVSTKIPSPLRRRLLATRRHNASEGARRRAKILATTPQWLNGDSAQAAIDWACRTTWGLPMPKKGITGHDDWVLTEALATALVALEQLEQKHQPSAHMDDIRKMLSNGKEPAAVSLHLAQAKCRLFPDLDPLEIYREYGIGEEYG